MSTMLDAVVIGAGAAGLMTGKRLADRGARFEIVDEHARVGDVWRERYRSLRLFTPRRWASLPGLRLDVGPFEFPTGRGFGDYLERYAEAFALPVRTGVRVVSLDHDREGFRLALDDGAVLRARRVVVATGTHRTAMRPRFAGSLDPSIRQLHSIDYVGPEQLADGPVLVVGAANSGTDLALEAAAAGHAVTIAGRHPGHVPVDIDRPIGNLLAGLAIRRLRSLTIDTERGRRARDEAWGHGVMLIRNSQRDLERAGIVQIERIEGVDASGRPRTADGTVIEATTVIWCTGSRPDHGWIELAGVFDERGWPAQYRGIVDAWPGLAFVGLPFQYSMASPTLMGMERDVAYVVEQLFATADGGMTAPETRADSASVRDSV